MIVVDTNVLAYLVIEGDRTPEAESLLASDPAWAAPRLWRSELANVLALYVRRGEMSEAEAVQRHEAAGGLVTDYDVPVDRVLAASARGPCSAYDAEFVVLAQDLGVSLATADKALIRAFPGVALPLTDAA